MSRPKRVLKSGFRHGAVLSNDLIDGTASDESVVRSNPQGSSKVEECAPEQGQEQQKREAPQKHHRRALRGMRNNERTDRAKQQDGACFLRSHEVPADYPDKRKQPFTCSRPHIMPLGLVSPSGNFGSKPELVVGYEIVNQGVPGKCEAACQQRKCNSIQSA